MNEQHSISLPPLAKATMYVGIHKDLAPIQIIYTFSLVCPKCRTTLYTVVVLLSPPRSLSNHVPEKNTIPNLSAHFSPAKCLDSRNRNRPRHNSRSIGENRRKETQKKNYVRALFFAHLNRHYSTISPLINFFSHFIRSNFITQC